MIRILMWGILIGSLITIAILTAWGTAAILMGGNV
jgi:hypothetical protein